MRMGKIHTAHLAAIHSSLELAAWLLQTGQRRHLVCQLGHGGFSLCGLQKLWSSSDELPMLVSSLHLFVTHLELR